MLSSLPSNTFEILLVHILWSYLGGIQITSLLNCSEVAESIKPHIPWTLLIFPTTLVTSLWRSVGTWGRREDNAQERSILIGGTNGRYTPNLDTLDNIFSQVVHHIHLIRRSQHISLLGSGGRNSVVYFCHCSGCRCRESQMIDSSFNLVSGVMINEISW